MNEFNNYYIICHFIGREINYVYVYFMFKPCSMTLCIVEMCFKYNLIIILSLEMGNNFFLGLLVPWCIKINILNLEKISDCFKTHCFIMT